MAATMDFYDLTDSAKEAFCTRHLPTIANRSVLDEVWPSYEERLAPVLAPMGMAATLSANPEPGSFEVSVSEVPPSGEPGSPVPRLNWSSDSDSAELSRIASGPVGDSTAGELSSCLSRALGSAWGYLAAYPDSYDKEPSTVERVGPFHPDGRPSAPHDEPFRPF